MRLVKMKLRWELMAGSLFCVAKPTLLRRRSVSRRATVPEGCPALHGRNDSYGLGCTNFPSRWVDLAITYTASYGKFVGIPIGYGPD